MNGAKASATAMRAVDDVVVLSPAEREELAEKLKDALGELSAATALGALDGDIIKQRVAVIMTGYPADKIVSIIKVVKKITGMPLVPAKVIVQGPMPVIVKDDIADAAEAEDIKRQLEAVGATVQLRSEPAPGVEATQEALNATDDDTNAALELQEFIHDLQSVLDRADWLQRQP